MKPDVLPEADTYFRDFSAYLSSGDTSLLAQVFPQAEDLSVAAVYRNGFLRSCVEALRASFPVLESMVGKEYFDMLAKDYIAHHPPVRSTFIGYGERFPIFIRGRQDQHQRAYLYDFSCLDQAWMHAYFAEDSKLLNEQDIETWQHVGNDISALHASLPHSARLLTLDYAISELWLKLKSGAMPTAELHLDATRQRLLLWRDQQDQINLRVVNDAEYGFLAALLGGTTLLQAATAAIEIQPDFPVLNYFSELLNTDVLAVDRANNRI